MEVNKQNKHEDLSPHNIIQIHNNVPWDWQYFIEYFLYLVWMWGKLCGILSFPHNIVMDMNNVMPECMDGHISPLRLCPGKTGS